MDKAQLRAELENKIRKDDAVGEGAGEEPLNNGLPRNNRAQRISDLKNIKSKRLGYHGGYMMYAGTPKGLISRSEAERHVGKVAHTAKCCSCWMCCNVRRVGKGKNKLTMQEQKQLLKSQEMLTEI